MSGIGDTLRSERQRQGRSLADAAAETRVRESYLLAIEEEDFDVLGGDVYSRGFIRLYGKYLGVDAEALVQQFKDHHERPQEVTAIPGATMEEMTTPMRGLPRVTLSAPVLAGVGIVVVLTALFLFARGGGEGDEETVDPSAPGPAPAETAGDGLGEDALAGDEPADPDAPVVGATDPLTGAALTAPDALTTTSPGQAGDGEVLQELTIVVTATAPIRLSVDQGQPVLSGFPLDVGEQRTLTDPAGDTVTFTVSDFSGAEITVNGDLLASPQLAGQTVQISCTVGDRGCNAVAL